MMGGRSAERVVLGTLSTGAANDLQRATELARKMVREFGMSERIGPMAWGSEGAVFLGEDLVHTRDYSDETARVIDEEVERILRDEEDRTRNTLREHRPGLVAVAEALLERETVDGAEVSQLVDSASISHTTTSDDSSGASCGPRPSHESHAADENSATSQAASARGKSARSSCFGTGYASRGGASGGRRRRNHANAPTATRITAAIRSR